MSDKPLQWIPMIDLDKSFYEYFFGIINWFVKEMELFLEAGQNYAFLIELVVHYMKLTDRRQVKLIYLSPVNVL